MVGTIPQSSIDNARVAVSASGSQTSNVSRAVGGEPAREASTRFGRVISAVGDASPGFESETVDDDSMSTNRQDCASESDDAR